MADTPDLPKRNLIRHVPLLVILLIAVIGAFTLGDYLSFETLREHREALLAFRDQNFLGLALAFICIYVAIVSFSLPGAAVASVTGGKEVELGEALAERKEDWLIVIRRK